MAITVEQFREALPGSLREHVTDDQLDMILNNCCIVVDAVNGCTLPEMQSAVPALRGLGIIAIPGTQGDSGNLISVTFLKR